ncbi:MAG TPA: hypothetical protein VLK30_09920 [Candidatus Limnocylindrales bacterium]|nr:hypothetical protein [Candidatus Limnocylindrales bacterium]
MSMMLLRRALIYLAATAFAVVPFAAQAPAASAASSTGTLFAITSAAQTLVKIDPSTGAFTQVANLNTPNQPQSTSLVSDPRDHRLFALRTSVTGFDPNTGFPIFLFELLNIDSQTGLVVANPSFTGAVPQTFVFDTSSGTLFGLTQTQVVKVTPATAAITPVANIPNPFGSFIYSMGIDSASHTIYVAREDISGPVGTNTSQVFSIDDSTGAISPALLLDQPVRQIAVDGSQLFGITDCCTFNLVSINSSTGVTTPVASIPSGLIIQFGTGVDPGTHTVFVNVGTLDPNTFAFISSLLSINDQTGAESTNPLTDGIAPEGFAFEAAVAVTAGSIIADLQNALTSGAINNHGIANSLLKKLQHAAAARSGGDCAGAARDYQAFINEVSAQSGKHVAASTASQLISEAQFLIANCP